MKHTVYVVEVYNCLMGQAVEQLVAMLHYKPEGSGYDTRWYHWNFSLT